MRLTLDGVLPGARSIPEPWEGVLPAVCRQTGSEGCGNGPACTGSRAEPRLAPTLVASGCGANSWTPAVLVALRVPHGPEGASSVQSRHLTDA